MVWDLLGAYILLSSGLVANRYLLGNGFLTPSVLVGIRMTLSGALIIAYCSHRSHRLRWDYVRHDLGRILMIAFVATLLPAYLKASALRAIPAAKQTLLGSIDPFITALYAYMLWGESISGRKLLGMVIGFAGIAVAALSRAPGELSWGVWLLVSWPELASIASVAVSRYGWILVQQMMQSERYLPHEITAIAMVIAGSVSLIGAVVTTYQSGVAFMIGTIPEGMMWPVLSVLGYTTLIGNIMGYTAYSYALKRHSATVVALTGLSMPIFVALIEWLCGLATPQPSFFVAIVLLTIGFGLFFSEGRRRSRSSS